MRGDPFVEHREEDEVRGVRVTAGVPFSEDAREEDGRFDADDFFRLWMSAVFGWRGDHVFAAAQRADGVDGATLLFEEWAGDAECEVAESEGVGGLLVEKQRLTTGRR